MSYPSNDAQEWRDAAMFDNRPTRWVSGLPHDADDVPDEADL